MIVLYLTSSRIHERIITLRFLGIILIVIHNVFITKQFITTFARMRGGPLVEVTMNSKETKLLRYFVPITTKNADSVCAFRVNS